MNTALLLADGTVISPWWMPGNSLPILDGGSSTVTVILWPSLATYDVDRANGNENSGAYLPPVATPSLSAIDLASQLEALLAVPAYAGATAIP